MAGLTGWPRYWLMPNVSRPMHWRIGSGTPDWRSLPTDQITNEWSRGRWPLTMRGRPHGHHPDSPRATADAGKGERFRDSRDDLQKARPGQRFEGALLLTRPVALFGRRRALGTTRSSAVVCTLTSAAWPTSGPPTSPSGTTSRAIHDLSRIRRVSECACTSIPPRIYCITKRSEAPEYAEKALECYPGFRGHLRPTWRMPAMVAVAAH